MRKYDQATQDQTRHTLRELLPAGTTVYTVLLHQQATTNGNMTRYYHLLAVADGRIISLDLRAAILGLGYSEQRQCIRTDAPASNLVDQLSRLVYGRESALKHDYL